MTMLRSLARRASFTCLLGLTLTLSMLARSAPAPLDHWQQAVRASPYWISQGAFANLMTLRRWVLTGSGYCADKDRHLLFDRRATFLGYFSNPGGGAANQAQLNHQRQALAAEGKVTQWSPGAERRAGYPFALSCDQPDARLDLALQRYTGAVPEARLWGTWNGLRVGRRDGSVSLHTALLEVYRARSAANRISLPEEVLSTLAGKVLIESGGRPRAHSAAGAKGIMQLSPAVLGDCGLAERHHFHRLAQIDCAFALLEHNHRLLEADFKATFGHLPTAKADQLYAYLLLQAYHGGVGRVRALLTDPELNGAARYFAEHAKRFSAGDIALGMVYHNLGRNRLGFASLYYVVDVGIAKAVACRALADLPGCEPPGH